jgi:hypothetical protein
MELGRKNKAAAPSYLNTGVYRRCAAVKIACSGELFPEAGAGTSMRTDIADLLKESEKL